jgi:hypothetical protein
VHLAGFAPAFPLSFYDRKYARKPPVPIASGVGSKPKKITAKTHVISHFETAWCE